MTPRYRKAYTTKQAMGTNGRLACLQCGADITAPRRRTFCSDQCSKAFDIIAGRSIRVWVFRRDKGVCAKCGVDTLAHKPQHMHRPNGTGHLWQADHIKPVAEGGGQCGLDNYRTLCIECHKGETAALRRRLSKKKEGAEWGRNTRT